MKENKNKAVLFLLSQMITLFGSSITQFAMVWYVTLKTQSGIWVSLMTIAAYLPQFIISFFAGVWADRYSRKKLIILSDGGIALVTLLLLLGMPFIGEENLFLGVLVLMAAIRSIGTGIQTPAVSAATAQIVPEDQLMKFNGINATIQYSVQFVAPAVAGAVLSFGNFQMALSIDIVTAVMGIGVLSLIVIPKVKKETEGSMFSELKEGIDYAKKEAFIGRLLLVFGLFIFLSVPAGFMASLFVTRYFGNSYWNMTLVEVIGFIGMAAGGLLIGTWGGFKNRVKTLAIGMMSFGVLGVGMGCAPNMIVYLILMAIYGIALTMVQTASTTLLQENVEQSMQGRMFGLYGAMFSGFLPIGMLIFGPLADHMSMRLMMVITGAILMLLAASLIGSKTFYHYGEKVEEG